MFKTVYCVFDGVYYSSAAFNNPWLTIQKRECVFCVCVCVCVCVREREREYVRE